MFATVMQALISSNSSFDMVFTVPWVPTGMKKGVSSLPWDVVSIPVRALDSVLLIFISNILIEYQH